MKRTKKVLLASLFGCLFLCLGGNATNSYATTNLTVTDFAGLQSAFTTANANTAEDYVVTINGTIQATAPLTLTSAKMTLTGTGTILGYGDGTISYEDLIKASKNASLTIDGIEISGHKSGSALGADESTIYVKNGKITNNKGYVGGGIEIKHRSTIYIWRRDIKQYIRLPKRRHWCYGINRLSIWRRHIW